MSKIKRVISNVLVIVLCLALLPVAQAETTSQAVWLEAEQGTVVSGEYVRVQDGKFSGGAGLQLNTSAAAAAQVDFSFTVPKEGLYEIQILTSEGERDYVSKFHWNMDNQADTYCSSQKYNMVYQQGIYNVPIYWYSLGSKQLTAGTHTFSVKTSELRAMDSAFMYHFFDAVTMVPKEWNWVSDTIQQPYLRDYAWLEAERGTNVAGQYAIVENASASGGKLCYLDTTWSQVKQESSQIDFVFEVKTSGLFDMKILSSPGNATWLSQYKWKVDSGVYSYCSANAESVALYTEGQYGVGANWYSLGQMELSAGIHTISIMTSEMRSSGDFMFHYFDVVTIVPSQWKWTVDGIKQPELKQYVSKNANEYTSVNGDFVNWGYMCLFSSNQGPHKLNYDIVLPETGMYDVWIASTSPGWPSDIAYSIDGGESKTNYATPNYGVENTGAYSIEMKWYKVDTAVILNGAHSFSLEAKIIPSENRYVAYIDKFAIVPAGWNWTPAVSATPQKVESDILWVEAESVADFAKGIMCTKTELASGNGLPNVNEPKPVGTAYSLDYLYKAPKAGEYSIYALASQADVDYHSKFKFGLDGNLDYASSNPDYTKYSVAYTSTNGIDIAWQKIDDVVLDTNYHTISFACDEKRQLDSNYVFALDMFAIVPKNNTIDMADKNLVQGIAELQKSIVTPTPNADFVTSDLMLTNRLARDTVIEWTSSNTNVISNTGKVTRPQVGLQDETVTLTAVFSVINANQTLTYTQQYQMLVPAMTAYAINNFAFDYTQQVLTYGTTISVSAQIEDHTGFGGNAVLVIALYDENHKLIKLSYDQKAYSTTNYSATLALSGTGIPQDLSKYSVKAYLLNGLDTIKPMIGALEF